MASLPRTQRRGVPAGAAAKTQRKRRVLIADDNRDAAESLAMLLEIEGHTVTVVHDGQQALAAIEASRPEVALLDIGMPELDGYEVARRVRGDSRGRSTSPSPSSRSNSSSCCARSCLPDKDYNAAWH